MLTDQRGNPFARIFNDTVDISAYESGGTTVIVSMSGEPANAKLDGADVVVTTGDAELFRQPANVAGSLMLREIFQIDPGLSGVYTSTAERATMYCV